MAPATKTVTYYLRDTSMDFLAEVFTISAAHTDVTFTYLAAFVSTDFPNGASGPCFQIHHWNMTPRLILLASFFDVALTLTLVHFKLLPLPYRILQFLALN
jgi:hypothetical protein